VKKPVSKFAFRIQPAALHLGGVDLRRDFPGVYHLADQPAARRRARAAVAQESSSVEELEEQEAGRRKLF
jgi:hypothetical protein